MAVSHRIILNEGQKSFIREVEYKEYELKEFNPSNNPNLEISANTIAQEMYDQYFSAFNHLPQATSQRTKAQSNETTRWKNIWGEEYFQQSNYSGSLQAYQTNSWDFNKLGPHVFNTYGLWSFKVQWNKMPKAYAKYANKTMYQIMQDMVDGNFPKIEGKIYTPNLNFDAFEDDAQPEIYVLNGSQLQTVIQKYYPDWAECDLFK